MLKELSVQKTYTISATPKRVWDAITDPEKVKQYFFGTQVQSSFIQGSPIVFKGRWEGQNYEDKGTILEIKHGALLQYSYWSSFSGLEDKEENYSQVSYQLEAFDQDTKLTIIQKGFASEQAKEHAEQGWTMVLSKMKELLEKNEI